MCPVLRGQLLTTRPPGKSWRQNTLERNSKGIPGRGESMNKALSASRNIRQKGLLGQMSEKMQNLISIEMVYSVFWMIYIKPWDICCNGILLIIFLSNKYSFSTSSVPGIHEPFPPPFLLLYEINVFHNKKKKMQHHHRAKAASLSFIRGHQKNKYN